MPSRVSVKQNLHSPIVSATSRLLRCQLVNVSASSPHSRFSWRPSHLCSRANERALRGAEAGEGVRRTPPDGDLHLRSSAAYFIKNLRHDGMTVSLQLL